MARRAQKIQPAKTAAIDAISKELASASSCIFTEYRGLTVGQITRLRRKLSENDCQYRVVRNNFARIAFEKKDGSPDVTDYLVGPTALAFVSEDANAAAKALFDFSKDVPALVIKGAVVDGEVYDAEKIEAFAKLPGKNDLIAMFMSTINATTAKFVRTLQAIVDKDDGGSVESTDSESVTTEHTDAPTENAGEGSVE